ncbi:myosin-11-like isoform X2 [Dicentrarchus labrax]|uniref:myosin-11-like isoform X2 n=1 Tax=Dicentrarchus labrax TaxID=13489 RepID=UPI0021F5C2AE|nr:myosin-11-like isoform X2 [Dicentrarchus labrax]
MDITEENMTLKEMLEKIAELDYGQSQLRDLNAEMRHWLDVADDEIATLRSENAAFKKQVKAQEKIISEAQQVEAEPCRSLLADELDVKTCSEKRIQKLEKEYTMIKEENKKLTAELKSLWQERERDKTTLNKFTVALQTLEKDLQIKHSKETVEECSNIMKDLRLTNQELRKQLEDTKDEASFAVLSDVIGQKEGSLSPLLSFAEEIKLLASSAEVKTSKSNSKDLRHEENEAEELLDHQSLTVDLQTKRCAGNLETAFQRAGLLMLFLFVLTVLAFVASGSCAGNSGFFSMNTLWSSARLMLQPYCTVHYGALPPI